MRRYVGCSRLVVLACLVLGVHCVQPRSRWFVYGIPRATAPHDELPAEDGRTSLAVAQWAFQLHHSLKHSAAWLTRRERLGDAAPMAIVQLVDGPAGEAAED